MGAENIDKNKKWVLYLRSRLTTQIGLLLRIGARIYNVDIGPI